MRRLLSELGLYLLYGIFRFVLSLRYRLDAKGLDEIKKATDDGILFLPNHPAETDPLLMTALLWPRFRPRPLVVEHFYYQYLLKPFMDLVRVLPIPSMDRPNQWQELQVDKLKNTILSELGEGENFLIYPSGMLKRTPEEKIGGASMIFDLLQKRPQTRIALVRTTGLWGSSFSTALTQRTPAFGETLWEGFKILLKNGIFFAPRRTVSITISEETANWPREGDKITFNAWLENWYNKDGPEPLHLVRSYFWSKAVPKVVEIKEEKKGPIQIDEDAKKSLLDYLGKLSSKDPSSLESHLSLSMDLGLDSIDTAQVYVFLEERFGIEGLVPGQLQTIEDAFEAIAGVKKEVPEHLQKEKPSKWPRETDREVPKIPDGETIQEVFLKQCRRSGGKIACADRMSGSLSYNRLKKGALVLAEKIKTMPGEHIGILLPSSVAANVVILAVLMANKTPVMLNWTTGARSLEHAKEVCGLEVILTSYRFLSRIDSIDIGSLDPFLVMLEHLRSDLSLATKLKGVCKALFFSDDSLLPHKEGDRTAVVLFTSGTETKPKGVPLTHKNILSCQRGAFSTLTFFPDDILYSVLPPFHSFGFTVTGLLPILAGMKVCFAPDPTDSRSLAVDIERWKPTIFCCAPSFITQLLRVAKNEQLASLRLVVSGAEKTPDSLFETFQTMKKKMIEGYGISECSPIVTIEREGDAHKGVGKPIPGVDLVVVHSETGERLPQGEEGEVCISGPNVFNGYLGVDADPFLHIEGKRWYRSGDRGLLHSDGTLTLTGRLKRFVKIGGEMISLQGLEEDLINIFVENQWSTTSDGPILAVEAEGKEEEKPQLVLFTKAAIDLDQVNEALKELRAGRLLKIARSIQLEEIPVTGTGKIHYRKLKEIMETHEDETS